MKMITNIVTQAKDYCLQLLQEHAVEVLCFHNVTHTLQVFENVKIIAKNEHIAADEQELLLLAALFHDVGHIKAYKGHEVFSAQIAREFLTKEEFPEHKIQLIEQLIGATQMPQKPSTILEQIICDADLFHLGTQDFCNRNAALRKEWEVVFNKHFTDAQWQELNVEFLSMHQYHTNYCKQNLAPVKQKHIVQLSCNV